MRYTGPASDYFEKSIVLDDGKPINWNDYHYRELIDMPYIRRMVMRTSRQVGKSIFNCIYCLKLAHIPMFRIIYMAPSQNQADEFSKLKFGKILNVNSNMKRLLLSNKSPIAVTRDMKAVSISNDVHIKTFATGATMKIGYAADEAGVERVRGGSADALIKDESQSMMLDLINPVLDPMLDSSDYHIDINTGTPLDPDDDLCKLFDTTSQHTMVVKCHHCNKYTTLMDLRQVGKETVLCSHCFKPVDIREGKFVPMNPGAPIFGIHFNKLMMPGVVYNPIRYQDLVDKVYAPNRDDNKLYAEQLGVPKGSAGSMLREEDVRACQVANLSYSAVGYDDVLKRLPKLTPNQKLVAGIDWGGGANDQNGGDLIGKSHTAFTLNIFTLDGDRIKQRLIYHKLYPLPDVKEAIDDVISKIRRLPSGSLVGSDFMGGAYANSSIFEIAKKEFAPRNQRLSVLPVRFAQLTSLMEPKPAEFRVDVDRNFSISRFIKKKILDHCLELPSSTEQLNEVVDSWMSMKSATSKFEPGAILWVLKKSRSNDIAMAMIAAWISYCVANNMTGDVML